MALREELPEDTMLRSEISSVLNRYSKEGGSGTPDFILARYLLGCLELFDHTTRARDKWWSFEAKIGGSIPAVDDPKEKNDG